MRIMVQSGEKLLTVFSRKHCKKYNLNYEWLKRITTVRDLNCVNKTSSRNNTQISWMRSISKCFFLFSQLSSGGPWVKVKWRYTQHKPLCQILYEGSIQIDQVLWLCQYWCVACGRTLEGHLFRLQLTSVYKPAVPQLIRWRLNWATNPVSPQAV